MDKLDNIKKQLYESAEVKRKIFDRCGDSIIRASELILSSLKNGGKILLCGNGGSAADSQHLATEFVARLRRERAGIPAVALTTDTSLITALSNDYKFDIIFSRQIETLGSDRDVLIAISTSGNSRNVVEGVKKAKELKIRTVTMLGGKGGILKGMADAEIIIPTLDTQRIQEGHITVGHIICDLVEMELFD